MRPLCIMSLDAIRAQRLLHHAVCAFACDNTGAALLAAGSLLEPTVFGHVPAFKSREEYAAQLMRQKLGYAPQLIELCALTPSAACDGACLTIYRARLSSAMLASQAGPDLSLASLAALPLMADLCGPALRHILACLPVALLR